MVRNLAPCLSLLQRYIVACLVKYQHIWSGRCLVYRWALALCMVSDALSVFESDPRRWDPFCRLGVSAGILGLRYGAGHRVWGGRRLWPASCSCRHLCLLFDVYLLLRMISLGSLFYPHRSWVS